MKTLYLLASAKFWFNSKTKSDIKTLKKELKIETKKVSEKEIINLYQKDKLYKRLV